MSQNSRIQTKAGEELNQKAIGKTHIKQAAELATDVIKAMTGTAPTAESKELTTAIKAEPSQAFRLEDANKASQAVKQLDNPASLITLPSEGGTVLTIPTP